MGLGTSFSFLIQEQFAQGWVRTRSLMRQVLVAAPDFRDAPLVYLQLEGEPGKYFDIDFAHDAFYRVMDENPQWGWKDPAHKLPHFLYGHRPLAEVLQGGPFRLSGGARNFFDRAEPDGVRYRFWGQWVRLDRVISLREEGGVVRRLTGTVRANGADVALAPLVPPTGKQGLSPYFVFLLGRCGRLHPCDLRAELAELGKYYTWKE